MFWGDERCVPPDHPESNYGMAKAALLDKVGLGEGHAIRILGEMTPAQEAARDYERKLRLFFRDEELPRFDLILLGLGEDGHTASLFPGTAALAERERWVVANHVERLNADRITLTLPAINAAHRVLFLVSGESKAAVVREIFRDDVSNDRFPAQLVRPGSGEVAWLLDAAAAQRLWPEPRYRAKHI